jgi:hypothetical protein
MGTQVLINGTWYNLTFVDATAALLLGILGSLIAAFVFKKVPDWALYLSSRWAERSKKAARQKIDKLNAELTLIREFKQYPSYFLGWLAARIGLTIMFFAAVICGLIAVAQMRIMFLIYQLPPTDQFIPIGPEFELPTRFVMPLLFSAEMICVFFAARSVFTLGKYSNLDQRIASIEKQIERLKLRVVQTSD